MPHSSDFPYDGKPFWDTSSSTADCPDGLVPEYLDGPLPPGHPKRLEAEAAFREGFLEAAYMAAMASSPPKVELEFAIHDRNRLKEHAKVQVNGKVWYRTGYEVQAARLRGHHHALLSVAMAWLRPEARSRRYREEADRWFTRVELWASEPIASEQPHKRPPMMGEDWDQRPYWPPAPLPKPKRQEGNLEWVWRGDASPPAAAPEPVKPSQPDSLAPQSLRELIQQHPRLRRPVLHGLLRQGETLNVIAPPKLGKSWLALDLALAVAVGRAWLDLFPTEQGNVLLLDNELHKESLAHRFLKVMEARQIEVAECGDRIHVVPLRGKLKDIYGLGEVFDQIEQGKYALVILDAFYRVLPPGSDENSNATLAAIYNVVDQYALQLGCAFVLIHHSTKGSQSHKSVTDVGAGGSAMARATDSHLILRQHQEPGAVTLEAAVRSWPPPEPRCLRWVPPVWVVDDGLDPADLKQESPRRKPKLVQEPRPARVEWSTQQFVATFLGEQPMTRLAIEEVAKKAVGSRKQVERLLKLAEQQGLVYRWRFGPHQPVKFATRPQPQSE